jgi:Peptidase family M23
MIRRWVIHIQAGLWQGGGAGTRLDGMVWMGMIALVAALLPGPVGWRWPLRPAPPSVLRGFDPPAHPWEAGHRGVDLATAPGRRVYAAGPGRVSFARDLAGRGVVTVVHGRLRTTYLPVRPSVREGQRVAAGTPIGVVEDVLGHCGATPCLHWGLREGETYHDPLTLLGLGPVRLLPWWGREPPMDERAGSDEPHGWDRWDRSDGWSGLGRGPEASDRATVEPGPISVPLYGAGPPYGPIPPEGPVPPPYGPVLGQGAPPDGRIPAQAPAAVDSGLGGRL